MHSVFAIIVWVSATVVFASTSLAAQIDDSAQKAVASKSPDDDREDKAPGITSPSKSTNATDPARLVKLNKQGTVLLDPVGKRVLLKTRVCLTDGVLEMLVCQEGTKEHESILSIDARSYVVHAGLLALGAKTGRPIQFVPEFSPPTGQELDIFVTWRDKRGKIHRRPVNEWIRYSIYRYFEFHLKKLPAGFELPANDDLRYDELNQTLLWFGPMTSKKRAELLTLSSDKQYQAGIRYFYKSGQSRQLKAKFVFAGSSFYVDEDTGERQYRGEGGYLICVANFPSATIDIAIESSAEGEGQMFEAWKERLPPKGTDVTVELIPRGLSRPQSKSLPKAEPVDNSPSHKAASTGPPKLNRQDDEYEQSQRIVCTPARPRRMCLRTGNIVTTRPLQATSDEPGIQVSNDQDPQKSLLVTLCTYDEKDNLQNLISSVLKYAPDTNVMVVDDNSPDGTGKIADRIASEDKRVCVLHRTGKLGLGTATVTALQYAINNGYTYVLNLDADFSHHPKHIPALRECMNRCDVAIGSRYVAGGGVIGWGLKRHLMSRAINYYARFFLGLRTKDNSGSYRCYRVAQLQRLDFDRVKARGYAFQEEILYRCRRLGCTFEESPIVFDDRRLGYSKINWRETVAALWWIMRLGVDRWRGVPVERSSSRA